MAISRISTRRAGLGEERRVSSKLERRLPEGGAAKNIAAAAQGSLRAAQSFLSAHASSLAPLAALGATSKIVRVAPAAVDRTPMVHPLLLASEPGSHQAKPKIKVELRGGEVLLSGLFAGDHHQAVLSSEEMAQLGVPLKFSFDAAEGRKLVKLEGKGGRWLLVHDFDRHPLVLKAQEKTEIEQALSEAPFQLPAYLTQPARIERVAALSTPPGSEPQVRITWRYESGFALTEVLTLTELQRANASRGLSSAQGLSAEQLAEKIRQLEEPLRPAFLPRERLTLEALPALARVSEITREALLPLEKWLPGIAALPQRSAKWPAFLFDPSDPVSGAERLRAADPFHIQLGLPELTRIDTASGRSFLVAYQSIEKGLQSEESVLELGTAEGDAALQAWSISPHRFNENRQLVAGLAVVLNGVLGAVVGNDAFHHHGALGAALVGAAALLGLSGVYACLTRNNRAFNRTLRRVAAVRKAPVDTTPGEERRQALALLQAVNPDRSQVPGVGFPASLPGLELTLKAESVREFTNAVRNEAEGIDELVGKNTDERLTAFARQLTKRLQQFPEDRASYAVLMEHGNTLPRAVTEPLRQALFAVMNGVGPAYWFERLAPSGSAPGAALRLEMADHIALQAARRVLNAARQALGPALEGLSTPVLRQVRACEIIRQRIAEFFPTETAYLEAVDCLGDRLAPELASLRELVSGGVRIGTARRGEVIMEEFEEAAEEVANSAPVERRILPPR